MQTLLVEQTDSTAWVRLHRPAGRNALNTQLIEELTATFLSFDAATRVIVLTGADDVFCAGADLTWMKESVKYTVGANQADAARLATLFKAINNAPQVVIGKVAGAAMGGGAGLVACCDLVVACNTARFAFSEVRLGLIPAVIAPYVIDKIGISQARRYFVTGELFDAASALQMGLVHWVVEASQADAQIAACVETALKCGPIAVNEAKSLIRMVSHLAADKVHQHTIDAIARLRVSPEAQEGLAAFLEKRQPLWSRSK